MLQKSLYFIVHQCIWGWHSNKTFSCAFHLQIFMFPTGSILLNGLIFIAAGKYNSAAKPVLVVSAQNILGADKICTVSCAADAGAGKAQIL